MKKNKNSKKRIFIALGGNSLGINPSEQKILIELFATKIIRLIQQNYQIIIGFGNGPQIGIIMDAFTESKLNNGFNFLEIGAMVEGYIEHHLLIGLSNALIKANLDFNKNGILPFFTHPIINSFDQSLLKPTKPIGKHYQTLEELHQINPECAHIHIKNKGYQRLVSSPQPISFIGANTLKKTIQNSHSIIIIGTGGSVPVVKTKNGYKNADAVCDKDFVAAKIANDLNAEKLIVLTSVNYAYLNFDSSKPKPIFNVDINQMQKYILTNQFETGSMLPKVQGCINFVKSKKNKIAIISDLEHLLEAVELNYGTIINRE